MKENNVFKIYCILFIICYLIIVVSPNKFLRKMKITNCLLNKEKKFLNNKATTNNNKNYLELKSPIKKLTQICKDIINVFNSNSYKNYLFKILQDYIDLIKVTKDANAFKFYLEEYSDILNQAIKYYKSDESKKEFCLELNELLYKSFVSKTYNNILNNDKIISYYIETFKCKNYKEFKYNTYY